MILESRMAEVSSTALIKKLFSHRFLLVLSGDLPGFFR